jgi:hypothetical protein
MQLSSSCIIINLASLTIVTIPLPRILCYMAPIRFVPSSITVYASTDYRISLNHVFEQAYVYPSHVWTWQ